MNAEQRHAKTATARRKPTGMTPAWALKLGSLVISLGIFAGSFDYAANHLSITNAPLQPSVVASSEDTSTSTETASATSQPTLTLSPTVSTTTRTPVTKTTSS